MDCVFLLNPEARGRFLRSAARALRCDYICLWSPVYGSSSDLIPASYFASQDGYWHREDDGGGRRPSSSAPSTSRRLFDCYRRSFCIVQCSYVPGWAYKSSLPYIELKDSDLLNSVSLQVQRQFYQEAGIKTAVFLGCANGEIEFGITSCSINGSLQMNALQVFSEDFIHQSLQLGDQELLPAPLDQISRPSSSSSSLRSLSVSSPEHSSVLMTMASPPEAAALPQHQVTVQFYGAGGPGGVPFPSPASEDAAMARAILAVITSTAAGAAERGVHRSSRSAPARAFVPYARAHAARADAVPASQGQNMIKKSIDMLRVINVMRLNEAAARAAAQEVRPTSNQLHHMISERKRREKLNESFEALRTLLPPSSKRDKASVLANTRKYVSTLKAQIMELQEQNRALLLQGAAHRTTAEQISDQIGEIGSSPRSVRVEVDESESDRAQGLGLTLTVGSAEGDMVDVLLGVLEGLKTMGGGDADAVHLTSVTASKRSGPSDARIEARLKLRVVKEEGGDWDEETFQEGVKRAIDAAVAKSRPSV